MAVTSAGPYANHLHLAPDRQPRQHLITKFYRPDALHAAQQTVSNNKTLEMWANAQRDGRPAEYRWRPLFNAAVWMTPTARVPCSNAAKTRSPLKFAGVPQTR